MKIGAVKLAFSALLGLVLSGCLGSMPERGDAAEPDDAPGTVAQPAVLVDVVHASASDPDTYVSAGEAGWARVSIMRDGSALPVSAALQLQVGDEIETREVVAALRYGTQIEVYVMPHTRIRIGSIFVKFGEIWVRVTGALKEKFKVETEFVTAGVEGTQFIVRAGQDGSMAVDVQRGVVLCTSKQGRWVATRLQARDSFKVARGVAPVKTKLAIADLQRVQLTLRRVDAAVRLSPNLIKPPAPPAVLKPPAAPAGRTPPSGTAPLRQPPTVVEGVSRTPSTTRVPSTSVKPPNETNIKPLP